jgi:hypothetical protein
MKYGDDKVTFAYVLCGTFRYRDYISRILYTRDGELSDILRKNSLRKKKRKYQTRNNILEVIKEIPIAALPYTIQQWDGRFGRKCK